MTGEETILWRRLDHPGHEAAASSPSSKVNAAGFVTLYPGFCRVEAAGR